MSDEVYSEVKFSLETSVGIKDSTMGCYFESGGFGNSMDLEASVSLHSISCV